MLTRVKQVGLKLEATEGVAESLSGPDFSRNVKNATAGATRTAARYQRDVRRPGLSQPKDLVGGKLGEIPWQEEMVGGSASTDAPWYATLQGCGFQRTQLKIITVTGVTGGSFAAGDTIGNNATAGSATKRGRVAWTGTVGGAVKIVYEPLAGAFANADTVYNYATSQVSGTSSAPANAGQSFRPMSETGAQIPPSATVEERDGEIVTRLVGARGQGSIMFKWGEVPIIDASFRGPLVNDATDGTPLTGALVSAADPGSPKSILGDVGTPFLLDAYSPILTEATLQFNNTLADRRTIGSGGVTQYSTGAVAGGYAATRITGRRLELAIDPERPALGTYNFIKKWQGNADVAFHMRTGELKAAGDTAIVVNAPSCSFASDSYQETDRDGVVAISGTLKFNGTNDDELSIDHVCLP